MEVVTPISELTDEEIKTELKEYGVKFHHKTGSAKLADLLKDARKNPEIMMEDIPVATDDRPYEGGLPNASEAAKAAAAKALGTTGKKEALKLIRMHFQGAQNVNNAVIGITVYIAKDTASKTL